MIYTFTPNPALDLGGTVEAVIPNEKVYVDDESRYPGGNAINAARIAHTLGEAVIVGGFIGGETGAEVAQLLRREGVRTRFVHINGNTRINITVSDRRAHCQTRLSFPGPLITALDKLNFQRWLSRVSNHAVYVTGGSMPRGFSSADLVRSIRSLNRKNARVLLDVPGKILKQTLRARPWLIKPNLQEFQDLCDVRMTGVRAVLKHARRFAGSVENICVSSVDEGALLLTPSGTWFGRIPNNIRICTTVGAGDSMVGAMAACLQRFQNPPADLLLRWALAAAAATLMTPGTQLGKAPVIRRMLPKISITRIV